MFRSLMASADHSLHPSLTFLVLSLVCHDSLAIELSGDHYDLALLRILRTYVTSLFSQHSHVFLCPVLLLGPDLTGRLENIYFGLIWRLRRDG